MTEEQKAKLSDLIWEAIERNTIGSKKGKIYNGVIVGNLVDKLLCVIRDNYTPNLPESVFAIMRRDETAERDFIARVMYDGGEAYKVLWKEFGGDDNGYYLLELKMS